MSAFVLGKDHIDALVRAHHAYKIGGHYTSNDELNALGAMIWAENVKSVSYRYPSDGEDLPGPINLEWATPYQYPSNVHLLTPVAILKMVQCYEYQSCEHPSWESSEAHKWAQRMRSEATSRLPGYEAAPWEYIGPRLALAAEQAADGR